MLKQYTLAPVRVVRRIGPFLIGARVIIQDITDAKGKRISPKKGIADNYRVKVSDRDGLITAWADPSQLEMEAEP